MKIAFVLTLIYAVQFALSPTPAQAQTKAPNPQSSKTKKTSTKKPPTAAPLLTEKINLKPNEYLLNFDTGNKIFSTKMYEGLNLSTDCFESKVPKCDAYTKSIKKLSTQPEDKMKSPYHNNLGAIHCELMGGKGLIAKTSSGNDDDFCVFNDGSMVSSWSAYYKTHPPGEKAKNK